MAAQPIAIHGHGILPGLLAVHLLAQRPLQSLLVLSGDSKLGGSHLEPVVASRLNAVARSLVEPFVVSSWPAYYLVASGKTDLQEDEVLLLLGLRNLSNLMEMKYYKAGLFHNHQSLRGSNRYDGQLVLQLQCQWLEHLDLSY